MTIIKIDFCSFCNNFEACEKRGDKLCCSKCIDKDLTPFVNQMVESNKEKIVAARPLTSKIIFKKEIPNEHLKTRLINFFNEDDNSNKIFKSSDLHLVFDDIKISYLRNMLAELVNEKFLFTRPIHSMHGYKNYNIYSKNKEMVFQLTDDESTKKILDFVKNYSPVNSRNISDSLKIELKNVSKIVKTKLINSIEIYQYKKQFWYIIKDNEKQRKALKEQLGNHIKKIEVDAGDKKVV